MNIPKKLLCVILFFVILSVASLALNYFNVKFEFPEMEMPPKGFYKGFTGNGILFFITWIHPQFDEVPLRKYGTLHSNQLYIYAFSFSSKDVELEIVSYLIRYENRTIKEGNVTRTETVEVPYDVRTLKVPIHVIANSFTKTEVELPTSKQERRVDIKLGGRTVFTFKHETWRAYLPAPRYTFGTLFLDRLGYMIGTMIVCFLAFIAAKITVNRVKYVPEMPRWAIAILPSALLFMLAFGVIYIVYYYALVEASYTYVPIFLIAWIFGLYMMRPRPTVFWFYKRLKPYRIRKKVRVPIEVVEDHGRFYTISGWRDFLLGRRKEIVIDRSEQYISYDDFTQDREYYFEEMKENEDKIYVKVAGPEFDDIDAYESGLLKVENLSSEKEYYRQEMLRLQAEGEAEVDKRVKEALEMFRETFRKALPWLPEVRKALEEEEKEE